MQEPESLNQSYLIQTIKKIYNFDFSALKLYQQPHLQVPMLSCFKPHFSFCAQLMQKNKENAYATMIAIP